MVHEKSRLQGFQKTYVGRLFSGYLKYPLSWGFLRVLGAWMTFKKADMAKTLKTRFSMIETNPLNHKWLDFVILTGLALYQFQTNWLLSRHEVDWRKINAINILFRLVSLCHCKRQLFCQVGTFVRETFQLAFQCLLQKLAIFRLGSFIETG